MPADCSSTGNVRTVVVGILGILVGNIIQEFHNFGRETRVEFRPGPVGLILVRICKLLGRDSEKN